MELLSEAVTDQVIGCFFEAYNELGAGFVESVYAAALAAVLEEHGIPFEQEAPLRVIFRGRCLGQFRADLVVANQVVVELKAVSHLWPVHEVQLVNYLRASGLATGLLLNFGPRAECRRRVYSRPAPIRVNPR